MPPAKLAASYFNFCNSTNSKFRWFDTYFAKVADSWFSSWVDYFTSALFFELHCVTPIRFWFYEWESLKIISQKEDLPNSNLKSLEEPQKNFWEGSKPFKRFNASCSPKMSKYFFGNVNSSNLSHSTCYWCSKKVHYSVNLGVLFYKLKELHWKQVYCAAKHQFWQNYSFG